MKSQRKNKNVVKRREVRRPARSKRFESVMQALESVKGADSFTEPILEQLQQCPEAFKTGEMIGKMFETLKYGSDQWEGGDRLLPPAGLVMPLV